MMGKRFTTPIGVLLFGGLLAGAIFAAACTKEKEVEVTRQVPVTVVVPATVQVPVTVEVPLNLVKTAQAIRDGKIDVGKEYGLAPGQRYHTIHNTVLGMPCAACHQLGTLNTVQTVFTAQDVSSTAPGPVDKRPCLGCHSASGPAHELYSEGSP